MLKIVLIIPLIAILSGCASTSKTTISYSGEFVLDLKTEYLRDSTVFMSDNVAFKTASGKVISALVITHEVEELPADFVLARYPDYLLGISPTSGLSANLAEAFENSKSSLAQSYDLSTLKSSNENSKSIHTVCKDLDCFTIIVKQSAKDQILALYSQGFNSSELGDLIKGFK